MTTSSPKPSQITIGDELPLFELNVTSTLIVAGAIASRFHDEYLQTFNRPNVTLIDTAGRGVERISEKGVVVGGREIEIDCLIFATGFEVGTDYSRRAGYNLVGSGGQTLSEKWSDGVRTLHGIHIHGFPNCFMMSIAQSGFTVNFPHMINEQAKHIAYVISCSLARGIHRLEVSAEAEAEWVDAVVQHAGMTLEFSQNCTPGYYNNEGQPSEASRQNGFYFGGPTEFVKILEDWRADGSLKGLELR
jgi:cyclohexanone monooxygenase